MAHISTNLPASFLGLVVGSGQNHPKIVARIVGSARICQGGNVEAIPVQVAFQGGGAKLVDLLAVAEALQKAESDGLIRIERLAGTSAGSLVACLLAAERPIASVREVLLARGARDLADIFPPLGIPATVWRIVRNRSLYDEAKLRDWIGRLFPEVRQLRELKREVFVVATDLIEAKKRVLYSRHTHADHWLGDVLVDSCAFPFVFRSSQSQSTRVDGGLCENLPTRELVRGEVDHGVTLAVSFERQRPPNPAGFRDFAVAFISAAVENTVERALESLPQDRVHRIATDLGTVDFSEAFEKLGADGYRLVEAKAVRWIVDLHQRGRLELTSPGPADDPGVAAVPAEEADVAAHPSRAISAAPQAPGAGLDSIRPLLLEDIWRDRSRATSFLMRRLDRVYRRHHEPVELEIESSTFLVIANSLLDADSEDFGEPDEIRQSMRFRAADEPLHCVMLGLIADSADQDGSFLRDMDLSVTDEHENPVETVILPILDSTVPAGMEASARRAVVFFDSVLTRADGPHTIRQARKLRSAMHALTAVRRFVAGRDDFEVDAECRRLTLTVKPGERSPAAMPRTLA